MEAAQAEIVARVFELCLVSRDLEQVNAYLAENLGRVAPYAAYGVLMAQDHAPVLSLYPSREVGPAFLDAMRERILQSSERLGLPVEASRVQIRTLHPERVSPRRRAVPRSLASIPIFGDDGLCGLISLASVERDTYIKSDLSFLSSLAEMLGRTWDSLRRQVAEREQELDRLRETDRLKDKFLSAVSHELRSPLTVLTGLLEILRDGDAGPTSERQRELLASSLEQSTRLRWLMENLLDMSRMEYGTLDLSREPARLDRLVERAAKSLQYEMDRRGLRLEVALRGGEIPRVCADPNRITQVLVNLMDNAAKYTPTGGRVRVAVKSLAPVEDAVQVEVTDTGRGIPLEEQEHVFDRFYRLGRQTKDAAGTGLGLYIAREIVETHQGRIGVRSEEGRGSTFYFTVPTYDAEGSLSAYLTQVVAQAVQMRSPLCFILLAFEPEPMEEAQEVLGAGLRSSESLFYYAGGRGVVVLGSFADRADARRVAGRLESRIEEQREEAGAAPGTVEAWCLEVDPGAPVEVTIGRVAAAVHEMAGGR